MGKITYLSVASLVMGVFIIQNSKIKVFLNLGNESELEKRRKLATYTTKDVLNVFQVKENPNYKRMIMGFSSKYEIKYNVLDEESLKTQGASCYEKEGEPNALYKRFSEWKSNEYYHPLSVELWKYCMIYQNGGAYIDFESPLLYVLEDLLEQSNYAIQGSRYKDTIHGAFLVLRQKKSDIAKNMIKLLMETSNESLLQQPLLLSKRLNEFIQHDQKHNSWTFLHEVCHHVEQVSFSSTPTQPLVCPASAKLCCEILSLDEDVWMLTPHPILPYYSLPPSNILPKPYASQTTSLSDTETPQLPFISIIREKVHTRPSDTPETPNLYHILQKSDCLPSSEECSLCLRNKQGADCSNCSKQCECYCKALCNTQPEQKFVAKHVYIHPPLFSKDPSRLVPRIVHQTWFEPVTREKYPNMSRLIQSWKQSGYEYRFYSDEAASQFLSMHFPPEVKQAYDSVSPGAFKADLFRYCVLLIHGGVYADMDVLLESNLDAAVPSDVGFTTPMDEPGTPVNTRMCLWNGFIASAPGHPFLAAAIQHVVNNIRNRFTSVDVDDLLCPAPELSISHAFDTLFTAGPCILGLSINQFLQRNVQTQYTPGDIEIAKDLAPNDPRNLIPGRSVILQQNKVDMGAHRFTQIDRNLVVAATDMPNYDDRKKLNDNVHYSETHVKTGIYGVEKLYVDNVSANEFIKFEIVKDGGISSFI